MQELFAYEFHNDDPRETLKKSIQEIRMEKEEKFALEILQGILKNHEDLIKKIKEFAIEWPLEKIAPVDRAILEIGTYEMIYSPDVPPLVALNEAIEIAKEFGDENAPKFINGVLSAILQKYCTHRDHRTGQNRDHETENI